MLFPESLNRYRYASVRYTSPSQEVAVQSEYPRRVAIGELSDEVLLNIFRYYLDVSPRIWPRLVHICHRWRRIVFASQRALRLRLFCTHGTPVFKTLDCWPALPIVVEYGGSLALDPPTPEDEDNIMAALGESDRVVSISLTVTSGLLEKLSAIERSFSGLEDLILLCQDNVWLTLSRTFRWGPHLRRLHLTRMAFPALLQFLGSSNNLVDLQLHEVLYPWNFSSEALVSALSGMAQLQSLSLHFLPTDNYLTPLSLPVERIILPALTRLNFRGITEFLESLVARIDAPRLGDIEVTFFNKFCLDVSKLGEFINRIEMHKSYCRAHIRTSERAISITLLHTGAPTCLKLQLLCEPLTWQLSFMAQVCICFSALLFSVEELHFSGTQPSRWEDSLLSGWLELINSLKGVKWFHVSGNLSTSVVRALQLPDRRSKAVLPALQKLSILRPGSLHAPLSEVVVSFMTSRRLFGYHVVVEYERPYYISELHGTGSLSQQVLIKMLPDDVLLSIFRHYLDDSPRFWPTLAWVCQRWRQIVFASPLGLNLRLYCTYGTPVSKTLEFWPALPIIMQYGGASNLHSPSAEDDNNIIAALKQSSRISSISLTVTNSLLECFPTIKEPFSELGNLVLLSQNSNGLALPSTFKWGSRLRSLHSTGVALLALPQLLSPSVYLVDLQLDRIPNVGYIPPDAFANALSGTTQLRTLSLHFLSFPSRRNHIGISTKLGERVALLNLTYFRYRGTSKYLDSFVARIDAPRLEDIKITFFHQLTFDVSQLGRFFERIEAQKSHRRADLLVSERNVSITFTDPRATTRLELQISCEQLDWKLSSLAQICDHFPSFLFDVGDLNVVTTNPSSGRDDVDGGHWLELIRSFSGAQRFHVAGELATDIVRALRPAGGNPVALLPALRNLYVKEPGPLYAPLRAAIVSFITSRRISGRPVEVEYV